MQTTSQPKLSGFYRKAKRSTRSQLYMYILTYTLAGNDPVAVETSGRNLPPRPVADVEGVSKVNASCRASSPDKSSLDDIHPGNNR
jgi:hypothetical protein